MRVSRFRVVARLHMASRPSIGTVEINRANGIVRVRPLRMRRTFDVPLADVASWIVRSQLIAEARERRASKRRGRRRS